MSIDVTAAVGPLDTRPILEWKPSATELPAPTVTLEAPTHLNQSPGRTLAPWGAVPVELHGDVGTEHWSAHTLFPVQSRRTGGAVA